MEPSCVSKAALQAILQEKQKTPKKGKTGHFITRSSNQTNRCSRRMQAELLRKLLQLGTDRVGLPPLQNPGVPRPQFPVFWSANDVLLCLLNKHGANVSLILPEEAKLLVPAWSVSICLSSEEYTHYWLHCSKAGGKLSDNNLPLTCFLTSCLTHLTMSIHFLEFCFVLFCLFSVLEIEPGTPLHWYTPSPHFGIISDTNSYQPPPCRTGLCCVSSVSHFGEFFCFPFL